jgi:hypothetical protein
LWEGTVFFVGEYGIPCRRVRYSRAPGEKAVFVGGYGILRRRSPASRGDIFGKTLDLWRHPPRGEGGWSLCRRVRYSLSESTVFLMCVGARMPSLRSLGYTSSMEWKTEVRSLSFGSQRTLQDKQEQRDLETRYEKRCIATTLERATCWGPRYFLLGTPVPGFGDRVGPGTGDFEMPGYA